MSESDDKKEDKKEKKSTFVGVASREAPTKLRARPRESSESDQQNSNERSETTS